LTWIDAGTGHGVGLASIHPFIRGANPVVLRVYLCLLNIASLPDIARVLVIPSHLFPSSLYPILRPDSNSNFFLSGVQEGFEVPDGEGGGVALDEEETF
jgi:hypothetical protein